MTDPGTLPRALGLEPLQRVSPSRFAALLECPLREVWQTSGNPGLLPKSPAAYVGIVTHKLLETASTADPFSITRASLECEWDGLVNRIEAEMASNWLERHSLPLERTAWRYAVRRLRAVKRALQIALDHRTTPPTSGPAGRGASAEHWVESSDGTVAGLIDRVYWDQDGPTLRDYKSGNVFEDGDAGLRTAYVVQLKLYAALFEETHGLWPEKLEIAPLRGDPVSVPFTREECAALLRDARSLREMVNDAVLSTDMTSLASPTPRTCKYCQYRPTCEPYRAARDLAGDEDEWPTDVWGTITELDPPSGGYTSLALATPRSQYSMVLIGRLSRDATRHPALTGLATGESLSLFDLKPDKVAGSYKEGRSTVIYRESGGNNTLRLGATRESLDPNR